MESAVVEDENDPSDSNNNSSTNTSVGDCINNTILATGVFTSAELYRLARAPITSQTTGHQRPHHIHAHHHSLSLGHQLPPPQLLVHHQQLQAVKLEQEPNQSQYCSNNGNGSRNTNGFSPDPAHHSHQMLGSPNPIALPQTSVTGSSSASSSPSYVVGMSQVSDLPPHKRLRRMHQSDGDAEAGDVRGHQTQLHHHQAQYSWTDGHSDADVSLIKSESSAGSGLYTHLHVAETPLSPHPTLYHHMQQSHIPSAPHHHHVHQQQQSQQQQVLKYQENGDTLSDFVNLVSALSCPSDGHFWPDQGPHQGSSHHGSDPSDEMDEAKSLREDQQEEDDLRDQHVASHQLQVMAQYGHLPGMQLPPPPPPPTARPVVAPVLDSRWSSMSSPPSGASTGYLLPDKDVSLGYYRPAFFVSQGLTDSSAQLMLMPQQQHSSSSQRELSSPVSRSNLKGSPSPPKTPS